jgi:hypothetical protein
VDDSQNRLQELSEALNQFRKLIETPGWAELVKVARAQAQARRNQVIGSPLLKMDDVLAQQWNLGEASGIETIVALPHTIIADFSEQRDEIQQRLGENDETE